MVMAARTTFDKIWDRHLIVTEEGESLLYIDHALIQLGMALLAVGQLHVQRFKLALGRHTALLQFFELRVYLGQIGFDLRTAGPGLLQ